MNKPVYGCRNCGAIFTTQYYDLGDMPEADMLCVKCGSDVECLGEAPNLVEMNDGLYLVQGFHSQGPFPSESDAMDHLWQWFGGRDAKKEEVRGSKWVCIKNEE